MLRFLQLFQAFRALLDERARVEAENRVLRETLELERQRNADLQQELIVTLRRTADAMARQATGRNVFERASEPVAESAVEPPVKPAQAAIRQRARNQAVIEAYLNEQRKQADEAARNLN